VSGITLEVDPNPDLFASAQFTEMSDDEKLSHASFDTYHAGIKTRDDLIAHGGPQQKDFDYDTEVLDTQYTSRFSALYSLRLSKQVELLGVSAAAQAPFRNLGSAKFEPSKSTPSLMGVSGARYVVSTTSDLSIRADILANASTKIQATQALKRYLLNHPQEIEHLQVLATEEAAG
jgi:hypothetical protein